MLLIRILGMLVAFAPLAFYLLPRERELRLRELSALDDGDVASALALARAALLRNPASPYGWADLADVFHASHEDSNAVRCFNRALQLSPDIPPIWIRAANFRFETGQFDAALAASVHVLETVTDYDYYLFAYFDRWIPDARRVFARLPPLRQRQYFQHLLDIGALDLAQPAWPIVITAADDNLASRYVGALLERKEYDPAVAAWTDYLGPRKDDYPRPNLLYNSGFEALPTRSPFDWQLTAPSAARDRSAAKDGLWSVKVVLSDSAREPVRQTARVTFGRYRLRAWIKTQGIADQTVYLRLYDSQDPARLDVRLPITGPHDWLPVSEFVEVPTETNLVNVEIFAPCKKPSGTLWLDQISVTRDLT